MLPQFLRPPQSKFIGYSIFLPWNTVFEEDPFDASDPKGGGLETRLLDLLDSEGYFSWDQLVEELAGDFEDRLEETLQQLQNENRVQYSGRQGGYTVVDDGE